MSLKRIGLTIAICASASLWASAGSASAHHVLPTSACASAADIPNGCFLGGGPSSAFQNSIGTPLASFTTPAIQKPPTPAVIVLYVDENHDGDFDDADEAKGVEGTPGQTLVPATPQGGTFRITYAQGAGTNPRVDFVTCHDDLGNPAEGLNVKVSRTAGTRDVDVEFRPTGSLVWQELTPLQLDQTAPNSQAFQTGFCVDP